MPSFSALQKNTVFPDRPYLHTYVFTGKDGEVTDVRGYYFPRKSQVLRELDKFKKGERK